MSDQLVSVYIPTKNRIELLKRAVDSVLGQTYKYVELIVVDDGSTDGSREYLLQMQKDNLLRTIFMPVSMGACVARNFGIAESSGDFVTGLDDDDYFLPDRLDKFITEWNKLAGDSGIANVAGLFDEFTVINANGDRHKDKYPKVVTYQALLENNIGSQVFAPRRHYLDAGLFDPGMPAWQDWDAWRRMSYKFGNFINIEIGTYVVDESHVYERITLKPEHVIRYAMASHLYKSKGCSLRARSTLIIRCLAYPSVKPNLFDLCVLAITGRLRFLLKFFIKYLRMH